MLDTRRAHQAAQMILEAFDLPPPAKTFLGNDFGSVWPGRPAAKSVTDGVKSSRGVCQAKRFQNHSQELVLGRGNYVNGLQNHFLVIRAYIGLQGGKDNAYDWSRADP